MIRSPHVLLPLACLPMVLPVMAAAQAPATPLSRVAEVRAMDRDEAARHLPVRIEGTVILLTSSGCFLHDGEKCIWVEGGTADNPAHREAEGLAEGVGPGSVVMLEGRTDPGGYAPQIKLEKMRFLRRGTLPEPRHLSMEALLSGAEDSQWIELEGVVQEAAPAAYSREVILVLATEGHSCVLAVQNGQGIERDKLVDARIKVRGVFSARTNLRSEMVGLRLDVSAVEAIEVVTPPPDDPFRSPRVALRDLLPFRPEENAGHRKVTQGVVNFTYPGRFFFLQDGATGVRVESATAKVEPGQEIEVAGFVALDHTLAGLRGGLVRPTGRKSSLEAVPVTAERLLNPPLHDPWSGIAMEDFDGRAVSLTGKLLRAEPTPGGGEFSLLVESGNSVFTALLPGPAPAPLPAAWVEGAEIALTGVCELELKPESPEQKTVFSTITGFRLWLPSAGAVRVLHTPSWWTARRLSVALGGTSVVLLLVLGWVWLLRREVVRRGARLAQEIAVRREAELEFRTTLRERTRLAHDLHDTLEQALTGLSLQLQAAELFQGQDAERSARHLRLAQQFLDRSREDVHRTVWDLRAQGLDGRGLVEALRARAESMASEGGLTIQVAGRGEAVPLPDFIAGNLFLLALEAITNALKHAQANRVDVDVEFSAEKVMLRIRDDGRGFDPALAPGHREGHFGLQGMRERVKRLGGMLRIESSPESGTRIEVEVPAKFIHSDD